MSSYQYYFGTQSADDHNTALSLFLERVIEKSGMPRIEHVSPDPASLKHKSSSTRPSEHMQHAG